MIAFNLPVCMYDLTLAITNLFNFFTIRKLDKKIYFAVPYICDLFVFKINIFKKV